MMADHTASLTLWIVAIFPIVACNSCGRLPDPFELIFSSKDYSTADLIEVLLRNETPQQSAVASYLWLSIPKLVSET